ncbi:MAG: carbon monoxide dehydrogenase [Rhodobacteraceae bacterium]|nr:carbon monoxide dehydrogenase [Paracoccaceae bacterium]
MCENAASIDGRGRAAHGHDRRTSDRCAPGRGLGRSQRRRGARACIPGCEALEKISPTEFHARVVQKIGPVKARFEGGVELVNIAAPKAIPSRARARAASRVRQGGRRCATGRGRRRNRADLSVHAMVGGKLARLGSRLINSSAKKLAARFFDNFEAVLHGETPDTAEAGAEPETGETAATA